MFTRSHGFYHTFTMWRVSNTEVVIQPKGTFMVHHADGTPLSEEEMKAWDDGSWSLHFYLTHLPTGLSLPFGRSGHIVDGKPELGIFAAVRDGEWDIVGLTPQLRVDKNGIATIIIDETNKTQHE
jgi:hypothetical protein